VPSQLAQNATNIGRKEGRVLKFLNFVTAKKTNFRNPLFPTEQHCKIIIVQQQLAGKQNQNPSTKNCSLAYKPQTLTCQGSSPSMLIEHEEKESSSSWDFISQLEPALKPLMDEII